MQNRILEVLSKDSNLWVEEASDPEDLWPSMEAPSLELSVPLQELSVPESKGSRTPGDLLPSLRDASIKHVVQSGFQVVAHHDCSLERHLQVKQSSPESE